MKVVIVGAGAVGTQLAMQLIDEKKDVVLIERDPEQARLASNRLDCMVITDQGNSVQVLRDAGTAEADFFVAVTDNDEVNLISCALVESEFSVPCKIARVRNIDYSSSGLAQRNFLGIDYIVNPEIVAAESIIRTIEHGAVSDIVLFDQSSTQMRHLTVEERSIFANRTLAEIGRDVDVPFLVAIILRNDEFMIPAGQTRIEPGDLLYLVATEDHFDRLYQRIGKPKAEIRKIVIVGGGKVGQRVASFLLEDKRPANIIGRLLRAATARRRYSVKIVDRDYERCKELSQTLSDALVIHADVSDEGVFEEEHFANSDLIVAVTGNQELNLIAAVYAKSIGIRRSIALVNKTNYTRIASQLGVDVPVSIKNSMVNSILRIVRRGNVRSVHSIANGELEVMDIRVDMQSIASGTAIRDLKLPRDTLIVSLLRKGETRVPDGAQTLEGGDRVIVISRRESIEPLQQLFTGPA